MSHFQIPKRFWLVASVVAVAIAAQVGFAAVPPSRVPVFSGKLTGEAPPPSEPLTLWYRQPAAQWTAALPLGNGKQGAMMFGGVDSEIICLNEDTLWSGGPYSPENPNALAALPQVRQLLFAGQYREAESLITQRMMGRPSTQAAYQPVGDLLLTFPKVETAENYRREAQPPHRHGERSVYRRGRHLHAQTLRQRPGQRPGPPPHRQQARANQLQTLHADRREHRQ